MGLLAAGVILRYGFGAEELAWSLAFLLLPLCCVYYPVSVLPDWLQAGCAGAAADPCLRRHALDPAARHVRRRPSFGGRLSLNAVYLVIGYVAFSWFLVSARVNGSLLQLGE